MAEPRTFRGSNRILQPGNHPAHAVEELSVFTNGDYCLSCWRLSLRERLSAFLFGRTWLYVLSGATQPPVWVEITRDVFQGHVTHDPEYTSDVVKEE